MLFIAAVPVFGGFKQVASKRIPGFVPRGARAPLDLPAVITPSGGKPVDARLLNISADGFSALCSATLPIGSRISLSSTELGRLSAQVRWALGARVGAVFAAEPNEAAKQFIGSLLIPGNEPSPGVRPEETLA
jgi:hypothetical protein